MDRQHNVKVFFSEPPYIQGSTDQLFIICLEDPGLPYHTKLSKVLSMHNDNSHKI